MALTALSQSVLCHWSSSSLAGDGTPKWVDAAGFCQTGKKGNSEMRRNLLVFCILVICTENHLQAKACRLPRPHLPPVTMPSLSTITNNLPMSQPTQEMEARGRAKHAKSQAESQKRLARRPPRPQ